MKMTLRKAKVSLEFNKMGESDLADFGDGVAQGLANNRDLPSPPVPVATITSQIAALRATRQQAASTGKTPALTRQAEQEANTIMLSLVVDGHYVEDTANQVAAGDVARAEQLILRTGYKLKKHAAPHARNFEEVPAEANTVHFRAKKAGPKKAEGHLWRYGITSKKGTPPDTLIVRFTLEADLVITDLPTGVIVGAQHASILPVSHGSKAGAPATAGAAAGSPLTANKSKHPTISHATSDPYHWTDFVSAVVS